MPEQIAKPSFAVCVTNDGSDDLSVGMLYRILPDEEATAENLLRVIDDSGEDYLYPADKFVIVAAPESELPRLLAASSATIG
jgi:hypothetical protein